MTDTNKEDRSVFFKVFGQKVSPKDYLSLAAVDGLSFHFGQSAEDAVLLRIFGKKTNGFYVDVGAFHPRIYSNTYILHKLFGWHGINIDASRDAIDLFKKERPSDINLNVAVGAKEGSSELYKFNRPARNTLSKDNLKRQKKKGDVKVIDREVVKVRPLSHVLKQHVPVGQTIDLLNIDIEGLDIEALRTNDWSALRPCVISIEDYNIQNNKPEDSPIYNLLIARGYRLVSHTYDTSIYLDDTFDLGKLHADRGKVKKSFQHALEALEDSERAILLAESYITSLPSDLTDNRLRALVEQNQTLLQKNKELATKHRQLRKNYSKLKNDNQRIEHRYKNLVNSKSWRYTKPIRDLTTAIKSAKKS